MQFVESLPSCEPTGVSSAVFLGEKGGNFVNSKNRRRTLWGCGGAIQNGDRAADGSNLRLHSVGRAQGRIQGMLYRRGEIAEVRLAIGNVEVSPMA
jgi:hypothetical protein